MNKDLKKCETDEVSNKCCCSCKNLIELFKHPWNSTFKGSIIDSTNLYACILRHKMDKDFKGILFEQQHGSCEMHDPK